MKLIVDDPQLKCGLQVHQAIERIEGGGLVKVQAWRQMTE